MHAPTMKGALLGHLVWRADVIVPACRIYLDAMALVGADTVIVPKVGLGDGMVLQLHRDRQGA